MFLPGHHQHLQTSQSNETTLSKYAVLPCDEAAQGTVEMVLLPPRLLQETPGSDESPATRPEQKPFILEQNSQLPSLLSNQISPKHNVGTAMSCPEIQRNANSTEAPQQNDSTIGPSWLLLSSEAKPTQNQSLEDKKHISLLTLEPIELTHELTQLQHSTQPQINPVSTSNLCLADHHHQKPTMTAGQAASHFSNYCIAPVSVSVLEQRIDAGGRVGNDLHNATAKDATLVAHPQIPLPAPGADMMARFKQADDATLSSLGHQWQANDSSLEGSKCPLVLNTALIESLVDRIQSVVDQLTANEPLITTKNKKRHISNITASDNNTIIDLTSTDQERQAKRWKEFDIVQLESLFNEKIHVLAAKSNALIERVNKSAAIVQTLSHQLKKGTAMIQQQKQEILSLRAAVTEKETIIDKLRQQSQQANRQSNMTGQYLALLAQQVKTLTGEKQDLVHQRDEERRKTVVQQEEIAMLRAAIEEKNLTIDDLILQRDTSMRSVQRQQHEILSLLTIINDNDKIVRTFQTHQKGIASLSPSINEKNRTVDDLLLQQDGEKQNVQRQETLALTIRTRTGSIDKGDTIDEPCRKSESVATLPKQNNTGTVQRSTQTGDGTNTNTATNTIATKSLDANDIEVGTTPVHEYGVELRYGVSEEEEEKEVVPDQVLSTKNKDICRPAVVWSDDNHAPPVWCVANVCVGLKDGSGVIGTIQKVDTTNHTAVLKVHCGNHPVTTTTTEITVHLRDLEFVPPKENDTVLVIDGYDIGMEGFLVCVDGIDAIVKNESNEYKIFDLGVLVKLHREE